MATRCNDVMYGVATIRQWLGGAKSRREGAKYIHEASVIRLGILTPNQVDYTVSG
jgi:hypothetical protein